ncbi:MAG: O-antigen ligase family protein [Betaproteobacteria bacterium]
MTQINLRLLAAFTTAYLFLLPTNHGTYLRSIAFGGSVLFAACALGWSLKERARRPDARLPMPPWPIVLTVGAWFAWSAFSYFWSVKPHYTSGQLSREVAENVLLIVAFYMACCDIGTFRRYVTAALLSFAILATLAMGYSMTPGGWDPALKHNGVGPYSTYVVLLSPLLLTFIGPAPVRLLRQRSLSIALGAALLALVVATARLTDNRMVWIALAAVFATAAIASAARWPRTFLHSPWRWLAPVAAILVVLGFAFADAARERAQADFPPNTSVKATIKADPRFRLWHQLYERIGDKVWQGYGFGRRIQAEEIASDLADLQLTHAHNLFASQWLQTGAVGLALFVAMLGAIATTFVSYVRARDDVQAFLGIVGLCVLAGFVVKNLTDDFLFRSNAKEFWALLAMLVGLGTRLPGTTSSPRSMPPPPEVLPTASPGRRSVA